MMPENLGIDERLRRKMGRPARARSIATRFTESEAAGISEAAAQRGLAVREWAREVLLTAAQRNQNGHMLLTAATSLWMLMSTVLRTVAFGEQLSPEAYAQVLAEVRANKHETARDVLSQYQTRTGGL